MTASGSQSGRVSVRWYMAITAIVVTAVLLCATRAAESRSPDVLALPLLGRINMGLNFPAAVFSRALSNIIPGSVTVGRLRFQIAEFAFVLFAGVLWWWVGLKIDSLLGSYRGHVLKNSILPLIYCLWILLWAFVGWNQLDQFRLRATSSPNIAEAAVEICWSAGLLLYCLTRLVGSWKSRENTR